MQVRNSNSVYKWSLNHTSKKLLQWKKNKASFLAFAAVVIKPWNYILNEQTLRR